MPALILLALLWRPPDATAGMAGCASTAGNPGSPWSDYQIIIWQDQTPARLAGLARLGVTAGRIMGKRRALDLENVQRETRPFLRANLRFYIENIATDFYAPYHRWHPDHPVTWLFDEAQRRHREDPASIGAFIRTPSLSDPIWLRRVALRLQQHVRAYARYNPLYYNLADEAGIADLAAAWDFDLGPASLAAMRRWLKRQYGTLAAVNQEWGTDFANWHAVVPMTTDAALRRHDQNFSAWADFKDWMDIAFARAVRRGTDAVHAADHHGLAALEGAQLPGWGGYDYSRLPRAVDVMEMYDFGNNVEVTRSLKPSLITLTTSSLANATQIQAIWRQLLLGGSGLILWDPDNAFVDDDGTPMPRGRLLAALAAELRSGLGAQLIASTPATDPVAILYSPASMRTQWLLDRRADGKSWAERRADTEYEEDNSVRAAMRRAAAMLTHLGVQPRWVTPKMIERGILRRSDLRVLVLPHSIALSQATARQISHFVHNGGKVLADSEPGVFDAHSRRMAQPLLANLTGVDGPIWPRSELQNGGKSSDPDFLRRLQQILKNARAAPHFTLSTPDGVLATDITTRIFRNGRVTIIGLHADAVGDDNGKDRAIILRLNAPTYIYDLRHPGHAKYADRIDLTLDRVEPALLALASRPLSAFSLNGPRGVRRGGAAKFTIAPLGETTGNRRIVHVEAISPDDPSVSKYAANLVSRRGCATTTWHLPLAPDDPIGTWIIRMTDLLAGRTSDYKLEVRGALPRARDLR